MRQIAVRLPEMSSVTDPFGKSRSVSCLDATNVVQPDREPGNEPAGSF